MQINLGNGMVVEGGAPVGAALSTTGDIILLGSWPMTFAYDKDGNLATATVTNGQDSWTQTYTWVKLKLTAVSGWVPVKKP